MEERRRDSENTIPNLCLSTSAEYDHTQKEPSPLCTAEREDANERLFRQIEENKKAAVSREEWLRMKELHKL